MGVIFRALSGSGAHSSLSHLFMGSVAYILRKWLLISSFGPLGPTRPKKGQVGTLGMDVEAAMWVRGHEPQPQCGEENLFS